jgi:hypothetical protein
MVSITGLLRVMAVSILLGFGPMGGGCARTQVKDKLKVLQEEVREGSTPRRRTQSRTRWITGWLTGMTAGQRRRSPRTGKCWPR